MTVKKVIVGNGCTAKAVLKVRLASPARQVLLTDKVNDYEQTRRQHFKMRSENG